VPARNLLNRLLRHFAKTAIYSMPRQIIK